jgi:hypothetical protein
MDTKWNKDNVMGRFFACLHFRSLQKTVVLAVITLFLLGLGLSLVVFYYTAGAVAEAFVQRFAVPRTNSSRAGSVP